MHQLAIRLFAPGISLIVVGIAVASYLVAPAIFEAGWVKEARAVHAEWAGTGAVSGARRIDGPTYLSDLRRLGPVPRIPDLSGGFLELQRLVHIPGTRARREAIHAGYTERRGCKLSLWISRAAADDTPAERAGAFAWVADGLRYVIVADGFQGSRLEVLGMMVRRMTEEGRGLYPHERQSLGLSAALNPPCRP